MIEQDNSLLKNMKRHGFCFWKINNGLLVVDGWELSFIEKHPNHFLDAGLSLKSSTVRGKVSENPKSNGPADALMITNIKVEGNYSGTNITLAAQVLQRNGFQQTL